MNFSTKKNIIFCIFGIIFLSLTTIVKAEDEEECLLCDAAVGMAVAVCEEFSACRSFMLLMGIGFLFVSLMMCIFGGEDTRRDMWDNCPSYRTIGATAGGYSLTRAVLNRR
jgi:hypothetical protein